MNDSVADSQWVNKTMSCSGSRSGEEDSGPAARGEEDSGVS